MMAGVSKAIINGFLEREIENYINDFNITPVSIRQEQRGLAILWICYQFKPLISITHIQRVIEFVDNTYKSSNFNYFGWYRIPPLESIAFLFTNSETYTINLIQNIACGQSWARGFFIECVSIICPLFYFENTLLRNATLFNLKYRQQYFNESMILCLSTIGDADIKKRWIKDKVVNTRGLASFYDELLVGHGKYNSSFFLNMFNQLKSYIIFNLISDPSQLFGEPTLFDELDCSFEDFTKMEHGHPLNKDYFDFGYLLGVI
jgi:hypothetical protein